MTFTYANFQPPTGYDAGLVEGRGGGVSVADDGRNAGGASGGGFRLWREGGIVHASSDGLQSPLALAILRRRLTTRFPDAPTTLRNGIFTDERVAFDADGQAYTPAEVGGKHFLLSSADRGAAWHTHPLPPSDWARIEFNDHPHRRPTNPPAVLLEHAGGLLELVLPERDRCGRLKTGEPFAVADDSHLSPAHSGAGNSVTSIGGGLLAVAYPSNIRPASGRGTTIKVAIVSRDKRRTLRSYAVGVADSKPHESPDRHAIPVILQDSKGVLHIIYCGHHDDLWYTRSLSSGYARWSKPERIGLPKASGGGGGGGHTYVAAVIDRHDQIHIVTRYAGDRYRFKLVYNRREADGTWIDQADLVEPGRAMYGRWGQRLSIDSTGRLILTFEYYAGDIWSAGPVPGPTEFEVYDALYPGALKNTPDAGGIIRHQPGQRSGGAGILESTDGGDTWRPATSKEL